MSELRKFLRKNKSQALIIIFLIGIVLVFVSGWKIALSGIGSSLIASALLSFLMVMLLGDDEYKIAKEWGLEQVYKTRGGMNVSCDNYMKTAKYIKTIGFGYKSWRDGQEPRIIQMLQEGHTIQIITMKPGCAVLKEREKDEQQAISTSIEGLIEWAKRLNNYGYPGKIEIRYHDHLPSYFVFIMNNRLFTGPYEYKKQSQQTLSFEYNVTGTAYEYYTDYFERLWNDHDFCEDALNN